jgi:hypothetical protein
VVVLAGDQTTVASTAQRAAARHGENGEKIDRLLIVEFVRPKIVRASLAMLSTRVHHDLLGRSSAISSRSSSR